MYYPLCSLYCVASMSGPLHMSRVTGLAQLPRQVLLSDHMEKDSLASRKKTKMIPHKVVLFAAIAALVSLIT